MVVVAKYLRMNAIAGRSRRLPPVESTDSGGFPFAQKPVTLGPIQQPKEIDMADLLLAFLMVYTTILMFGLFIVTVLGVCAIITRSPEDSALVLKIFKYVTLWPLMPFIWLIRTFAHHAEILN